MGEVLIVNYDLVDLFLTVLYQENNIVAFHNSRGKARFYDFNIL